jgi:hypothetical protein
LNARIKEFDIELVVYDEVEYFKQWDDDSFNYPYTPRKTLIGSYKFDITNRSIDYEYYKNNIKFDKSLTCLEEPWFN